MTFALAWCLSGWGFPTQFQGDFRAQTRGIFK
jgi:hypothetical protein